jgi:hypothetical protein
MGLLGIRRTLSPRHLLQEEIVCLAVGLNPMDCYGPNYG